MIANMSLRRGADFPVAVGPQSVLQPSPLTTTALHRVAIVDVEFGILRSRRERSRAQHPGGHQTPEPHEFHVAVKCTHATNYK